MLKKFYFFSALFILSVFLISNVYTQTQDTVLENTLLWKISRSDIAYESYLIGTHHFISSSFIDSSGIIKGICVKVNTFVIEADTADMDKHYIEQSLLMKANQFYSFKNDEDQKQVDTCVKNIVGYYFPYLSFKPMGLLILLEFLNTQKKKMDEVKMNEFVGIDNFFKKQGEKPGNRLLTLETPEEQIALLLDSISIERQTEKLVKYAKAYNNKPSSVTMLDTCYIIQNLQCIYYLTIKGYDGREVNLMITDRNKEWMKKLPHIINDNPTFIAVGAAHLVGPYGLLNLIRKAGYTVTPVMLN